MKRVVGFIVLAALLGVLALTAAAAPAADLNVLASYYPTKTPVLVSFRTDDDYLAALQSVVERINSAIRRADIPDIEMMLDEAIGTSGIFDDDATFRSEVRSWLGDVGAFGILSLDVFATSTNRDDDEAPALFVVQITDRAAAEAFFTAALADQDIVGEAQGDYTVFTLEERPLTRVAIGDAALFISNDPAALPIEGAPAASLAASETFGATLAMLPADDYNVTAYIEVGAIYDALPQDMEMFGTTNISYLESLPPIAVGATILNENALTLDVALDSAAMMAAYEAMGIVMADYAPLNPAFLERVPAGTPLVIHGNNLQAAYEQGISQLTTQMDMMTTMMDGEMMGDAPVSPQQIVSIATIAIQGVTGLNLEDELLPALTGDYAVYMGLGEALQAEEVSMMSLMSGFPLEFGMVFQITDAAIIPTLVDGITNALNALPATTEDGTQLTVGSDTIGDSTVTTLRIVSEESPFPIDLVFGGDDEVFFVGTPASARASLNPDGGLPTDADYEQATATMLDAPSVLYYLGGEGLQPLRELLPLLAGRGNREDVETLNGLLTLIANGSISYSYTDAAVVSRAVLTLAE